MNFGARMIGCTWQNGDDAGIEFLLIAGKIEFQDRLAMAYLGSAVLQNSEAADFLIPAAESDSYFDILAVNSTDLEELAAAVNAGDYSVCRSFHHAVFRHDCKAITDHPLGNLVIVNHCNRIDLSDTW